MTNNESIDASSTLDQMSEEFDELATVPADVLAEWVTDRGRCVWEATVGQAPAWTGESESDRELAARLCGGCPVRAECLALERRTTDGDADGVADVLTGADRQFLNDVWAARCRSDVEAIPEESGGEIGGR